MPGDLASTVMTGSLFGQGWEAALCKASLICFHLKAPQCLSLAHGLLPPGQRFYSLGQFQIPATPRSEEWDQVVSTSCSWPISNSNSRLADSLCSGRDFMVPGFRPRADNSELLHAEIESCPVQSQTCRCTPWAGENPARLSEGRDYVLPLDLFQSLTPLMFVPRRNTGMKVLDRDPQHWTGRENHCAFDDILQFANVSRPRVLRQGVHGFAGDRIDRFVHLPRGVLDEMPHELWDIFRTFAQRWNGDGENAQTIVKVAAKLLLHDHPFQVAMGRSYHPNVDSLRPRAAQTLEFPLLQ